MRTLATSLVGIFCWLQGFTQVSGIANTTKGIYTIKGDYYFNHNSFEKAINSYEKAVSKNPRNTYAIQHMVEAYHRLGNPDSADYWYNRAIILNPGLNLITPLKPGIDTSQSKSEGLSIFSSNGDVIKLSDNYKGNIVFDFLPGISYQLIINYDNYQDKDQGFVHKTDISKNDNYTFFVQKLVEVTDESEEDENPANTHTNKKLENIHINPGDLVTFQLIPNPSQYSELGDSRIRINHEEATINSIDTLIFGYVAEEIPITTETDSASDMLIASNEEDSSIDSNNAPLTKSLIVERNSLGNDQTEENEQPADEIPKDSITEDSDLRVTAALAIDEAITEPEDSAQTAKSGKNSTDDNLIPISENDVSGNEKGSNTSDRPEGDPSSNDALIASNQDDLSIDKMDSTSITEPLIVERNTLGDYESIGSDLVADAGNQNNAAEESNLTAVTDNIDDEAATTQENNTDASLQEKGLADDDQVIAILESDPKESRPDSVDNSERDVASRTIASQLLDLPDSKTVASTQEQVIDSTQFLVPNSPVIFENDAPENRDFQFRVQIAAARSEISDGEINRIYYGPKPINLFKKEGYFKYYIEETSSYPDAKRTLRECGVSGAFITAYKEGKKWNLQDAITSQKNLKLN